MINIKPEVLAGLKANSSLVCLLGGPRIYQPPAPKSDELPRITFFELTNFGALYADNREQVSEIHIQVDIWCKKDQSTSPFANEVDKTMKELGFVRTGGADLFEQDTQINHKAMRFKIRKEES